MEPQPYHPDTADQEPRDDLDVAYSIIRPNEYNDLLEQVNLGTGYYEEEDLAMQMRNVRNGLVMDIAFNETLRKHAVQETKVKLADEGFRFYNESRQEPQVWKPLTDDDVGDHGRTTTLFERGDEIWEALGDSRYSISLMQAAALEEKTNRDPFKAFPLHLVAVYHETTKSRGARTQDNYFGRKKVTRLEGSGDEEASGLLRRSRHTQ